jgi:tetratricopeptide (TPR) repeat protein
MMSLPQGTRISNQVAREICVREGAAATIDGAIASLGKNYVVTLQAIACQNGAVLAREQLEAQDKEHVLNAVGTGATAMRGKLGESLKSVQRMSVPLEEATTPSLEALQNYTLGYSEMTKGRFLPAVSHLERAIAIDSKFAMAHYYLALAFDNAGDVERCAEYAKQAFQLIDRVTEYERVSIAAVYYWTATGEVDKTIDAYQSGIRDFPRWWGFHNNLSGSYIDLGQFEEGLKEGLESARLEPNVEHSYRRQLDAYLCLGRVAEAKILVEKLRAKGLGGPRIHQRFLELAYVEDDEAAVARETQWFAGKPGEYIGLGLQAASLNVHGQRAESHRFYVRAAENARRQGLANAASEFEQADARADALLGNCESVRRLGRPALALAICGDSDRAEKLAAETSKLFPNGTFWNAVGLPGIRAAVALQRNQPAESVERLLAAKSYESAYLEVMYLRGLAYLRQNKGAEAATEFQKIVGNKGASWGLGWRYPNQAQFYSLSYLHLARAYMLEKEVAKAKKSYETFLELWKEPDPGIRIYKEARAEYAKL